MYKGKEICQGCRKPGTEVGRWERDRLCNTCEKSLAAGRARQHEDGIEYVRILQHRHAYRSEGLDRALHKLLSILNNPTAKAEGGFTEIKWSSGDNRQSYVIPLKLKEPLAELFLKLEEDSLALAEETEKLPDKIRNAIELIRNTERDEIFNEGVQRGRQLLLQLNNGDITLDDFDKRQMR